MTSLATVKLYNVTTTNGTASDADGARSTSVDMRGRIQDPNQTLHTLAQFTAAHAGSAADTKGRLTWKVNQEDGTLAPVLDLSATSVVVGAADLQAPEVAIAGLALQHDRSHALVFGAPDSVALTAASTGRYGVDAIAGADGGPAGRTLSRTIPTSLVPGPAEAATLRSGLRLWAPLTGGSLHDACSAARGVTATGSPDFAAGRLPGTSALYTRNTTVGSVVSDSVAATQYVDYAGDWSAPLTVAMWVNLEHTGSATLFSVGDAGTDGGINFDVGSGTLVVAVGLPNPWSSMSGGTLVANTWTHVAITITSAYAATVYVNGAAVSTFAGTGQLNRCSNLRLGTTSGNVRAARARYEDVRVYGRALSAAEMQVLALGPTAATWAWPATLRLWAPWAAPDPTAASAAASTRAAVGTLANQLQLWCPYTGGSLADSVQPSRAVAVGGAPGFTALARTGPQALYLDNPGGMVAASAAHYVEYTGPFAPPLTVATWMRLEVPQTATVLSIGDVGTDGGINIDLENDTLKVYAAVPTTWTALTAGTLTPGAWHHLAVSVSATHVVTVYLDGVPRATATGTGTVPRVARLRVGGTGATGAVRTTRGAYNDLRMYGRAMTPTEVRLLAAGAPWVAGTVANVADPRPERAPAVTGNPVYGCGLRGVAPALALPNAVQGTGTRALHAVSYPGDYAAPLTLACWFNTEWTTDSTILSLGGGPDLTSDQNGGLNVDVSGNQVMVYAAVPNLWTLVGAAACTAHTWYHLAITVSATHVVTMYINGISVGAITGTGPMPRARYVHVGCTADGNRAARARYSDLRAYAQVLGPPDIRSLAAVTPRVYWLPGDLGAADAGLIKTTTLQGAGEAADAATVVVTDGTQQGTLSTAVLSAAAPTGKWIWTGATWTPLLA